MNPLFALAAAAAASAAPVPPPAPAMTPATSDDTIVVTGTLQSFKEAVEHCKQGGCTPRQDVVASIRYAEGLFKNGAYAQARSTLQAAIARDRSAAKSDPLAVAALFEATTTVARHDGDKDLEEKSSFDRLHVLRDALPPGSSMVLQADLDLGDFQARRGDAIQAESHYAVVYARAMTAKRPDFAAIVQIHRAVLAHAQKRQAETDRLLGQVIADRNLPAEYGASARALAARFARERGDQAASDALIAALASDQKQSGQPLLVWEPKLASPEDYGTANSFDAVESAVHDGDRVSIGWADIGFTIKPDGTVETPEILRGSHDQHWSAPIVKTVAMRHYAPSTSASGTYRIERWTLTADYDTAPGSMIRRRLRKPRYEQLDVTPAPPGQKAAG